MYVKIPPGSMEGLDDAVRIIKARNGELLGYAEMELHILGKLWMPSTLAAKHEKHKIGDGPFSLHIEPTFEGAEGYVYGQGSGDFSEVVDWQAEITWTVYVSWYRIEFRSVIKDWADKNNEVEYMECLFPPEREVA